jgi:hypothetical protein
MVPDMLGLQLLQPAVNIWLLLLLLAFFLLLLLLLLLLSFLSNV